MVFRSFLLASAAAASIATAASAQTAAPIQNAPGSTNTVGAASARDPLPTAAESVAGPQAANGDLASQQEVVVTGIRASQRASLDLKRAAPIIVDAITATDVGKFPDANIADSLQRITGVSISRAGGEGQYITVRGFGPQYNNVLVNGRTLATDTLGREFDFASLSSALISRAEVYKTYQPQLQEGGIGATVNIVTARPLEGQTGTHLTAHGGGIYDILSKQTTPDVGGVATYKNDAGTFGIEASVNYTQRRSFDDQAKIEGWFAVAPNSNTVSVINGTPQSTGLTPAAYSYLNAGGTRTLYVPQAYDNWRATIDSRRFTANLTSQFRPTDTLLVTLDGLYTRYAVDTVNTYYKSFFVQPYFNDMQFDANGTVTNFTRPGKNFFAANPLLAADPRSVPQQSDNIVNINDRTSQTYQYAGNVKWSPAADLDFEADASHSTARTDIYEPGLVIGNYLRNPVTFSLVPGQVLPSLVRNETVQPTDLTNHYTGINNHRYRDDITELRLQGEWKADRGILQSVQLGGFYSSREKKDIEEFTPGSNYCAYCGYATPVNTSLVSPYTLGNFLPNSSGSNGIISSFYNFNVAQIIAYQSQAATLNTRPADEQASLPTATFLASGGYLPVLQPGQGFDVREKVYAAYLNTNWKGSFWSANIGLRVAHTDTASTGVVQPVTSISPNPGDSSLLLFTYGPATATTVTNHYTNVLPSANLKIDATSTLVLRAAVSKTLTRPTLSDLGPNNTYAGRVTQPLSSGGNPLLTPFTSWNYDASVEWYATRRLSLSADAFRKNFSGFLSNQTLVVPRNGTNLQGQPVVYNFYDTRPRNGNRGSVTGAEVAAQYAFGGTGILSGFGVGANYTRVTSDVRTVSPGDCSQIEGLSRDSYNANGFYEKYGLQARIAYNWRSKYLAVCQGLQGQPQNNDSYGQVDFNVAFDLNRHWQVYVDGVNMTNSYLYQYSNYYNRFLLNESTGRRILFGVRAKF